MVAEEMKLICDDFKVGLKMELGGPHEDGRILCS
jgi:hypothetical protein